MEKRLVLLIVLSLNFALYSQTPSEDPKHYVLDTSDDFNSFDSNLWNRVPYMTWGLETYNVNNVTASGGVLTLKCEKIGNNYISGGIETKDKKRFSYGYFEIESKFPASGNKGPWGGFWMHAGGGECIGGTHNGCYPKTNSANTLASTWHEIDIFEPDGCDTEAGTQFGAGTHGTVSPCLTYCKSVKVSGLNDLSASFNKYALIWTPQYVNVLFNGNSVFEVTEPKYIPSQSMILFLTFQIDAWGCAPNASTTFPLYWQFKNFKYYRLKTDCANGITQTNFNFATHSDYKVQKFYSLTNTTVPNNSNVVIRATDYIEFKGEFTVPLGSKFTATTHCETCPNQQSEQKINVNGKKSIKQQYE